MSFQQLIKSGGPFHHLLESKENKHSISAKLCSCCRCLEFNSSESSTSPCLLTIKVSPGLDSKHFIYIPGREQH